MHLAHSSGSSKLLCALLLCAVVLGLGCSKADGRVDILQLGQGSLPPGLPFTQLKVADVKQGRGLQFNGKPLQKLGSGFDEQWLCHLTSDESMEEVLQAIRDALQDDGFEATTVFSRDAMGQGKPAVGNFATFEFFEYRDGQDTLKATLLSWDLSEASEEVKGAHSGSDISGCTLSLKSVNKLADDLNIELKK